MAPCHPAVAIVVATVSIGSLHGTAAKPPHVLFILADDLGWNDVGYHQNKPSGANPSGLPTANEASGLFQTPTIDRLAAEGVRLESYYVQPLCSPTRATIMTGRYPSHTGLGPDVICASCWQPYGLPAREVLLPEKLKEAGYATHAIGKWHLGDCHEGYLPTSRGFDTFLGYVAGAESYYDHGRDFRSGASGGGLPRCVGPSLLNNYSTLVYSEAAARIVASHNASVPLFMYLAFQSVHNPYEEPPSWLVNVNQTYSSIEDYGRRVYAGMVQALDMAISNVTEAFARAGLWQDTVMVFSTDNGGIEYGNNYPLRGMKVYSWEGGIRGTAFVRGTDSHLAPLPKGSKVNELMHSTDWLPTLCRLAGASTRGTLPLDGVDQWPTLAWGARSARSVIIHNVPAGAAPVLKNGTWSTTTCLSEVDSRVRGCSAFGIIGGAIRKGNYKLLWSGDEQPGLQSNSPRGMRQSPPSGFKPSTVDTVPDPFNGTLYLFDISQDPTETHNLAASMTDKLEELLVLRDSYAQSAVAGVGWRYGFDDWSGRAVDSCLGPRSGSHYCPFGQEFACSVAGTGLHGHHLGERSHVASAEECQRWCQATAACAWWVWTLSQDAYHCHFKSARGPYLDCPNCTFGPRTCPGPHAQVEELWT